MKNTFDVVDNKFEKSRSALRSYITGFILSLIFTLIPYGMVTMHIFEMRGLIVGIVLFAIVQLFVQVLFFIHLPRTVRPYWNLFVFVFTLLIISFLVVGSLWIMYHLNVNMMGVSPFNSREGFIPQ